MLQKVGIVKSFTVSLDTKNPYVKDGVTYYKQVLYIDGQKTDIDGGYNKIGWDYFVSNNLNSVDEQGNLKDCTYFSIGVCSWSSQYEWHYAKMSCYSIKLYNRALTADEILDSYNKDIAYHQFLLNGGTVGTVEGNDVINY